MFSRIGFCGFRGSSKYWNLLYRQGLVSNVRPMGLRVSVVLVVSLVAQYSATPASVAATPPCSATPFSEAA